MTIRKVIELFFHQQGEGGFYAMEVAVKTEECPIMRLVVTFELSELSGGIMPSSVRPLSELYVGRKHDSWEVCKALQQFFADRKTTVKDYMKKINNLDGL